MMIIKCKMCGGDLHPMENATTCECEFCGTVQTIPRLDNDRRANLYDRANHFRRNNEYDKAMGIFEQILQEDRTDAEAYWSIILCRYGIEYVQDPATGKRLPTVNRTQLTSIFADEDYQSALEYADAEQKSIYEQEATAIDTIQKGILDISQKEKPFDVFICYKETDADGKRTPDSVLANDLYHQLTREGFKVFFSRITLEDKLGQQYEPYIFAALNSAKVMVVLGTKPEYFNAVWVKNEWSRYLALIRAGANKTLVPAYRDMDPYDLPDEFSHLQAQDMSKLGFIQDLIRGIKKITQTTVDEALEKKQNSYSDITIARIKPLIRRSYLFLEDGEWASADEYAEKILDQDPENSEAYIIKLLAERKVHTIDELIQRKIPLTDNGNYQKAVRFSDSKKKSTIEGWNNSILDAIELERQQVLLSEFLLELNKAANIEEYQNIKKRLNQVSLSADADMISAECDKKIKEIQEQKYQDALTYQRNRDWAMAIQIYKEIQDYRDTQQRILQCEDNKKLDCYSLGDKYQRDGDWKRAIELFKTLGNYKDSQLRIEQCEDLISKEEQLKNIEEAKEREKIQKKAKKRAIMEFSVLAIMGVLCLIVFFVIIPKSHYDRAVDYLNMGFRTQAIQEFEAAGKYKDSSNRIKEIYYTIGKEHLDKQEYMKAREYFQKANDYSDAQEMLRSIEENNFYSAKVNGFSGPVYVALILNDNMKIIDIQIGDESFQEGAGRGALVLKPDFQKQFIGKELPISYDDIEAVSGATITTKAVINAIDNITNKVLGRTSKLVDSIKGNEIRYTAVEQGFNGPIRVYLTLNKDKTIATFDIEKDGFIETEGLGGKALESSFQKQFIGKKIPITINDIDAVAGATKTTSAILEAINTIANNIDYIEEEEAAAAVETKEKQTNEIEYAEGR